MKSNYKYHAVSAILFLGIGIYFLVQKDLQQNQENTYSQLHEFLPWVIIVWGIFKSVNAYLMYRRDRNQKHETK